jgi:hypothetical protein
MNDDTTSDAPESGATSTPAADSTPRAPARTSLEQFSELLNGFKGGGDTADGGESHADSGDEPAKGKPKEPKNLGELAEALGVKAESLYAIEVPSSRAGEKPLTLGQLKDLMKQRDDFAVANLKLDEDRRAFEREKVSAEDELREMLDNLPADSLKPEAMTKLRANLEKKRALARTKIFEDIPEWREPVRRESDLKAITEHLKGYGIGDHFILANFDANVFRFLRDAQQLAERTSAALAIIKERTGKTPPTSSKRGTKSAGDSKERRHVGHVEQGVADFRAAINLAASRKH